MLFSKKCGLWSIKRKILLFTGKRLRKKMSKDDATNIIKNSNLNEKSRLL